MCFSCFLGINQNIVVQHVSTLFLLLVHQEMVESSTKYASIVIAEKVEKCILEVVLPTWVDNIQFISDNNLQFQSLFVFLQII